jgi:hypothetical protein
MEAVHTIALMMGSAWASGINLYATILMLGWMGSTGQVDLPPGLEVLTDPNVMLAAGFMYCVEFFADKVPGVDTGWDSIHTFIRIPAGAMLAAGAAEGLHMGEAAELTALLLGGGLAATSHAAKAGTRVLINTSPEPFSNWTASVAEDIAVIGGMWSALHYPWAFLVALVLFIALVIWLLPKIWRALKRIAHAVGSWFRGERRDTDQAQPDSAAGFEQRRREVLKQLYDDAANDRKPSG